MVQQDKLEMVVCPICHNLFPKRRRDLGYNYCISCSTEKKQVAIIEGTSEEDGGDGVYTNINIVSAEEGSKIEHNRKVERIIADEEDLDMSTFEDRERDGLSEDELASLRKINYESVDEDQGFSERVMDEMEQYCEPEEEEEEDKSAEEEDY